MPVLNMDKQKDVISGKFIWSKLKSDQNIKLGRPPFSAAKSVFKDKYRLRIDAKQGSGSRRFAIYGKNNQGLNLMVVFAFQGKKIRLISVRKDSKIRKIYEREAQR